MTPLATVWLPDLNPIDGPSILAALVISLLIAATSRRAGLPAQAKRTISSVAPILLLGACAITPGSPVCELWNSRSFPDACDFLAGYIYLVFGCALGLRCFDLLHRRYRLIAWGSVLFSGSFIVEEVAYQFYPHLRYTWNIYQRFSELPVTGAVFLFWLLAVPVLLKLDRQARQRLSHMENCCSTCGYNLTGNTSGTCPECGRKITTGSACAI